MKLNDSVEIVGYGSDVLKAQVLSLERRDIAFQRADVRSLLLYVQNQILFTGYFGVSVVSRIFSETPTLFSFRDVRFDLETQV